MRLLFDEDTPEQLMRHFQPHTCTHVNRTQLKGLKNGTLLAAALQTIESIQPGEVRYHYADELSEQKDRRKGKGPFRKS